MKAFGLGGTLPAQMEKKIRVKPPPGRVVAAFCAACLVAGVLINGRMWWVHMRRDPDVGRRSGDVSVVAGDFEPERRLSEQEGRGDVMEEVVRTHKAIQY
ncbi:hypothetical protein Taro_040190 [Colocasia esculenta]|uniref:DUF4094 domain-containing protein n=1 Tax=Colocasia esculenta TaxID=4460 RepID=A0A843WL34_COLES|nr:hypothetical protein [Colocasia esculenta]